MTVKERFKNLHLGRKIILIGSLIGIIGVVLPWYKDIDAFGAGDTYLGINGPLYLTGLLTTLCFLISFAQVGLRVLGKKAPKLPMSESNFYTVISAFCFLMLVTALSVFFHPRFGMTITDKSMGIGMILDFAASSAILFAAVLIGRKEEAMKKTEAKEREIEAMITHREPANLNTPEHSYDHGAMAVKNAVRADVNEVESKIDHVNY